MPIEKNRGYSGANDLFRPGYGSSGFNNRGLAFMDNGPPYIVKLLNLPVTSHNDFVEDLFRSRYTSYVKFKIVFDPSSQPLESGVVKKIAFVELPTFADQNRVLKWHDLYYRGSRRVVIEMAAFEDFKYCMAFNQEHDQQLRDVEREFLAGRNRPGWVEDHGRSPFGHDNVNGGHDHQLLNGGRDNAAHLHRGEQLHNRPANASNWATPQPPLLLQHPRKASVSDHPKPNPFGNAKPVDILLKQHEIEKLLININHTTIKTAGSMQPPPEKESRETKNVQPPVRNQPLPQEPSSLPKKPGFTPAPIPSSVYGHRQSLAAILSKNESDIALSPKPSPRKSATATPKPIKPTILKKKPAVTATQDDREESQEAEGKDGTDATGKIESGIVVGDSSETGGPVVEAANVNGTPGLVNPATNKEPESARPKKRRELKSRENRELEPRERPRERSSKRGPREHKPREFREPKEPKETKEPKASKDTKDPKETRELTEPEEQRQPKSSDSPMEPKEAKENQENIPESSKDSKWPRKPRESREPRELRQPREKKAPRHPELNSRGPKVADGDDTEHKQKSRIHNLSERNKSFASSSRPDFKKHLSEMTNAMEREHKNPRKPRRGGPNEAAQPVSETPAANQEADTAATSESKDLASGSHDDETHKRKGRGRKKNSPDHASTPDKATSPDKTSKQDKASTPDRASTQASVPVLTNGSEKTPENDKDGNGSSKNLAEKNGHSREGRGRRGGFRGRGFGGRGRGRGRGSSSSGGPGPNEGSSQG